jgi:hypothetical protein
VNTPELNGHIAQQLKGVVAYPEKKFDYRPDNGGRKYL